MTRRVLIHRPGSLGDTVVALPCLKLIRKTFPDAELRVLTNAPVASSAPPLAAVVASTGLIDGYFEYPIATRSLPRLIRLAHEMRRWRPDMLIYLASRETLSQVRRDAVFFRACGIREIVGLPLTLDLLNSRPKSGGMFEHEAERLARNMAALGAIDLADPSVWDLGLTEVDRALPRRLIGEQVGAQDFVAICVGTKQAPNDWGIENWRTLVEEICQIYPHKIVFVGAEADRAAASSVMHNLDERAVDLCGRLTVRESAALLEAAALFVGHDSGPMHLAAAVGTQLVAVFSRLFAPGVWYPMNARAELLYPPGESVRSITPGMVLDAVKALLPAGTVARKRAGEP